MRTLFIALLLLVSATRYALAVPETVGLRVTDVTTSSFSVVWMTDVPATPAVEVYGDVSMSAGIDEQAIITPMPDSTPEVAEAARVRGIMKVRIAGLSPGKTYYVRSVTADPSDPLNVGYSSLQEVTTSTATVPYAAAVDGSLQAFANDLLSFRVFIPPADNNGNPGLGDLLLLQTSGSPYPVSAFVGAGSVAPEGIVDLNNLFSPDRVSLQVQGGEKAQLLVYRGGAFSTLLHYRRLPHMSQAVIAGEPVKGFFADVNLDGNVDVSDFELFRKQFRTTVDDPDYNPDCDFVEDDDGAVDARDFARFAREFGRTGVQ